jgi:hypothetical protein
MVFFLFAKISSPQIRRFLLVAHPKAGLGGSWYYVK